MPKKHWEFMSRREDIDIPRILKEMSDEVQTVVRITIKDYFGNNQKCLFIKADSDELNALSTQEYKLCDESQLLFHSKTGRLYATDVPGNKWVFFYDTRNVKRIYKYRAFKQIVRTRCEGI